MADHATSVEQTAHRSRIRIALYWILLLCITAGATGLRLPFLSLRTMHTDEAVHAIKLGTLLETGQYEYNPREYHGPSIYYMALPVLNGAGYDELAQIPSAAWLRWVPAVLGALLVLLVALAGDGLGRGAALTAALLTALSPAMVFYSRYYIQEIPLICFVWLVIGALWRFERSRAWGWALLAGTGLGLMAATKETWVISMGALTVAGGLTVVWPGHGGRSLAQRLRSLLNWPVMAGLAVAAAVALLLLTNFLQNPTAILDAVETFGDYMRRGLSGDSSTSGAALHRHPFGYYLALLLYFKVAPGPFWSEGLIVGLGLIGMLIGLAGWREDRRHRQMARFLAIYTLILLLTYSAIPYKTPWNMLGFLHGLILLAGIAVETGWRRLRRWGVRWIGLALLLAGCVQLGQQAWRSITVFDDDPRNPYVYGHTAANLLRLVQRVESLVAVSPQGRSLPIQVLTPGSDCWPLPWYLRAEKHVGYWTGVPAVLDGEVVIASPALEEELDRRLGEDFIKEYYGLRPEVLLAVYIHRPLWDAFMKSLEP